MAKTGNSLVETKVAAPGATSITTGLLAWALVTFIPSWNGAIPDQLIPFIPVAAAWLTQVITGYYAPHTHRPDLTEPGGQQLAAVAAAVDSAVAQIADLRARVAPAVRPAPVAPATLTSPEPVLAQEPPPSSSKRARPGKTPEPSA